jgi:hypothetical protein
VNLKEEIVKLIEAHWGNTAMFGTVTAHAGGDVTVTIGADSYVCQKIATYSPVNADVVEVLRIRGKWIVQGKIG